MGLLEIMGINFVLSLGLLCRVVAFAGAALYVVYSIIESCDGNFRADRAEYPGAHRIIAVVLAVSLGLGLLIPTHGQAYKIAAFYVATNIEGVSDLPDNLVAAANQFLSTYTEEK